MPLINSSSDEAVQKNIEQLIKDGYPREQAVAIANEIKSRAAKKHS